MDSSSKLLEKVSQILGDKSPALITVYNIRTGEYTYVNKAIVKILGCKPSEFMKGGTSFAISLVHPEDLQKILADNQQALKIANNSKNRNKDSGDIINFEYRMRHKNGSWRWLHTDGSVFDRDEKGLVEHVINISVDITERKNRENKIKTDLLESQKRYKTFLSQSTEGIWRFEVDKPIPISYSHKKQIDSFYKYAYLAECNNAMAQMYGLKRAKELIGARLGDLLPKDDPKNIKYLSSFITAGYKLHGAVSYEIGVDGRTRIIQNNLVGILENGKIIRAWGTQQDITKEKTLQERLEFLDAVSKKLVVSLNQNITLQEISKLIIKNIADYCRMVTIDAKGVVSELEANHKDPRKVRLVKQLYHTYKDLEDVDYGIPNLLKTGKPELVSVIDDGFLEPYKKNTAMMKIVKQLGLKSYMGFPLVARGKIIGAITFSSVREGRHYSKSDQEFVQIIVSRIALFMDNFRLYSESQNAIAIRDNFISIASHELKTPLTSLKIYSELLSRQSDKMGDKANSISDKIHSQVDKLTQLISDLLDVSRIQSGKLEIRSEELDLTSCVHEIVGDLKHIGKRHKIIVKGELSQKVYADKTRIEQVLVNLITNAIKYSPKADKVIIRLQSNHKNAIVSIRDFGIGIDKRDQKRIFDRFYRANTPDRNSFAGLGLGLYITREIVKKHGGEVMVKSQKGKGSVFSFTVPYNSLHKA